MQALFLVLEKKMLPNIIVKCCFKYFCIKAIYINKQNSFFKF